ncbi:MAG: indolepyruvate oxidoreductase subunit beta [Thermoplasmatota archaeon]
MAIKNKDVTTIQIVGVGGQGALTVSKILGNAALSKNIPVVMSEIHGMAQRGGVVQTTIRLGSTTSPLPFATDMNVIVGFEPMEIYRARNLITPDSVLVVNLDPIRPVSVSSGGQKYPDVDEIVDELIKHAKKVYTLSAGEKANAVGNPRVANVVMLGALAGTGTLPFDEEDIKASIKKSVPRKALEENIKAFELGLKAVAGK